MEWILAPWPWYVSGPLIAFTMFTLLYVGKTFGLSSNLKTICTLCGAGKTSDFFRFDWKAQRWNLLVITGAIIGGFLASRFLSADQVPDLNPQTIDQLHESGFASAGTAYVPTELFGSDAFSSPKTLLLLLIGGLLVGFGARYAGGCTSGHSISGISNLQLPSVIATIGFFIGGLLMIHLVFPLLF
ncbi:YeeE/YedE family protein [Parapedobacter sp. GCM10030251]|uniref:YeeE/YedE family protein n=1 Tax=Parapedobacter sp. GCM10030251 TaxID=3273419 RepID=UPI0036214577